MQWISDSNGNRASVERWGSEEKAKASLDTLDNCYNCTDCTDCTDCARCTRCAGCTDCRDCTDCDGQLPHYFLPVSDPRGYTWLAIVESGAWRIRAGCRTFTIAEARAHWLAASYSGPASVQETVGFALDWIEAKPIK